MSCQFLPKLSIRFLPIFTQIEENSGKLNNFTRNFPWKQQVSNLRKSLLFCARKFIKVYMLLCLTALLYILRRKRHRSIQRKKLYLRMSSVLLNTRILAIYGLWKWSEIVLLTENRSQYVLLITNHSHTFVHRFVLVFVMPNGAIRIKIPPFDSA
jgi:membrane-associated HD superfamily phosphohydrolase